MLFTLISGVVVGAYFDIASEYVSSGLDKAGLSLGAEELRLFSFALCLALAAILLMLIGVSSYPVLLCLGGALGVARKPVLARITGNKSG